MIVIVKLEDWNDGDVIYHSPRVFDCFIGILYLMRSGSDEKAT